MSNTSKGWGIKGSKLWMQLVVNNQVLRNQLNEKISKNPGDIKWLSPLAGTEETFDEYKLNRLPPDIEKVLEFHPNEEFFNFWPKNQPQWDGLAFSEKEKTLFLIEAKAHITELKSKLSSSSKKSILQITDTMSKVFKEISGKDACFENWINKYYQLGNRMTFTTILNKKKPFGKVENIELILLNFTNDNTYIAEDEEKFVEKYEQVWKDMLGVGKDPKKLHFHEVYFNVGDIKFNSANHNILGFN